MYSFLSWWSHLILSLFIVFCTIFIKSLIEDTTYVVCISIKLSCLCGQNKHFWFCVISWILLVYKSTVLQFFLLSVSYIAIVLLVVNMNCIQTSKERMGASTIWYFDNIPPSSTYPPPPTILYGLVTSIKFSYLDTLAPFVHRLMPRLWPVTHTHQ